MLKIWDKDRRTLMKFLGQKKENVVTISARVSSKVQCEGFIRQTKYLKNSIHEKDTKIYEVKAIAGGTKERRKGLIKLIELRTLGKIRKIYASDKLTRFAYEYFVEFFRALGVEVVTCRRLYKHFHLPCR